MADETLTCLDCRKSDKDRYTDNDLRPEGLQDVSSVS